jgi:hypothetical protein
MAKIAQNWYNSPSIHAKVLCQIKKKLIEEFLCYYLLKFRDILHVFL